MSQREIEVRCACYIANLEGRKAVVTSGYNDPPFLQELDRRLRFMELRNDSAMAPPTHAPTWDALAWRICRLDTSSKGYLPNELTRGFMGALLPESFGVDLDTLTRMVGDLHTKALLPPPRGIHTPPLGPMPQLPKLVDDEETLDILRQRLFYLAGLWRFRIENVPMTKRDVYILASDLSLNAESTPKRPLGFAAPRPGWDPRHPRNAVKKPCCGCCACSCHPKKAPPGLRGVDTGLKSMSKTKGFFKFRWLRSLACWRKKDTSHDSDSSSSSSCVTA